MMDLLDTSVGRVFGQLLSFVQNKLKAEDRAHADALKTLLQKDETNTSAALLELYCSGARLDPKKASLLEDENGASVFQQAMRNRRMAAVRWVLELHEPQKLRLPKPQDLLSGHAKKNMSALESMAKVACSSGYFDQSLSEFVDQVACEMAGMWPKRAPYPRLVIELALQNGDKRFAGAVKARLEEEILEGVSAQAKPPASVKNRL